MKRVSGASITYTGLLVKITYSACCVVYLSSGVFRTNSNGADILVVQKIASGSTHRDDVSDRALCKYEVNLLSSTICVLD